MGKVRWVWEWVPSAAPALAHPHASCREARAQPGCSPLTPSLPPAGGPAQGQGRAVGQAWV